MFGRLKCLCGFHNWVSLDSLEWVVIKNPLDISKLTFPVSALAPHERDKFLPRKINYRSCLCCHKRQVSDPDYILGFGGLDWGDFDPVQNRIMTRKEYVEEFQTAKDKIEVSHRHYFFIVVLDGEWA